MSPAWIRKRDLTARRSYQVLYRRGGRAYPIESTGTFRTEKEAKLRRDLVAGWLALGLNPKTELAKLITVAPAVPRTLAAGRDSFLATRLDVDSSTHTVMRAGTAWLTKTLADRDPATLTVADLQEVIHAMSAKLKPATIEVYVTYMAALLDYLGAEPNPARSKHLRLPRQAREEITPPTADEFVAALSKMTRRWHLPLITLEQTGMRVGELETLAWRDVDERGHRFRLRESETKTSRARWVQVPAWLMEEIALTCAVEDRVSDRRVFQGFKPGSARSALAAACSAAGVPHFTPHDLRHRRATIWHHAGLPIRVQMERGGWATSEIPIEVYSHLMPLDEAPEASLRGLLVRSR